MGLEPTHLSIPEPKSGAATNYAKGAKTFLNIRMQSANVNLGIEALLNYAASTTYQEKASWTTSRDFVLADWQNKPAQEFIVDKLVHSDGFAPSSLDFQSNAFTRLA